jgi:hypothetical protein
MHAGAEEGPHLIRSDGVSGVQPVDAGHAGADPGSRSFSAFGVVGGQPDMAFSVASNAATCRVSSRTPTRR